MERTMTEYDRVEDAWLCAELDKSFSEWLCQKRTGEGDVRILDRAERIEKYKEEEEAGNDVSGMIAWWLETFSVGDPENDYRMYPCEDTPAVFTFV